MRHHDTVFLDEADLIEARRTPAPNRGGGGDTIDVRIAGAAGVLTLVLPTIAARGLAIRLREALYPRLSATALAPTAPCRACFGRGFMSAAGKPADGDDSGDTPCDECGGGGKVAVARNDEGSEREVRQPAPKAVMP